MFINLFDDYNFMAEDLRKNGSLEGLCILLPENKNHPDILVQAQRSYLGLNWYETHKALSNSGSFMPSPREFFDFLRMVDSKKRVYDASGNPVNATAIDILKDEILGKREPYRGENLDAYFADIDGRMYMFSHHRLVHERLIPMASENVLRFFMQNGYIDLENTQRNLPVTSSPQSID